jgi:hypothetical protein
VAVDSDSINANNATAVALFLFVVECYIIVHRFDTDPIIIFVEWNTDVIEDGIIYVI